MWLSRGVSGLNQTRTVRQLLMDPTGFAGTGSKSNTAYIIHTHTHTQTHSQTRAHKHTDTHTHSQTHRRTHAHTHSPSAAVQRAASSQSTRPTAYMSMRRKASRW